MRLRLILLLILVATATVSTRASAQGGTDLAERVKAGESWGTTALTRNEITACWATLTVLRAHVATSGRGSFPANYTTANLDRRVAEWSKAMDVAFAHNPDYRKEDADQAVAAARRDIDGAGIAARAEQAGGCTRLPGTPPPTAALRVVAASTAAASKSISPLPRPAAAKATLADANTSWSDVLERKCAAADAVACWQVGEAHELGRGTAKDPAKSFAAFSGACKGGIAEACFIAAKAKGQGVMPADQAAAFALYKAGCEAGSGDSCLWTAVRTETGRGAAKNEELAMKIYDRACSLRAGRSCLYMAQLWGSGENVFKRTDGPLALKYAAGGCNAGSGESCGLASHLAKGNYGAPHDLAKSDMYAAIGCELNHFGGCMNLGYAANQRKQHVEALRWYRKACALGGQQNSCQAVRTLEIYMADVAAGGAARHRWNEAQAASGAAVGQLLGTGDYAGAMQKAAYDMGSVNEVNRVLLASSAAGRIADVPDIYFVTFQTWQLSSQARIIFNAEARARVQRQRQESQMRRAAAASARSGWGSGSSWGSSTSTIKPTTYAAIPSISESAIYKNARESVSRSYCSAGWGCR